MLFGSKVHALFHPSLVPEKVGAFNAHDGIKDFIGTFNALDRALNPVRGDGERLLTVIPSRRCSSPAGVGAVAGRDAA